MSVRTIDLRNLPRRIALVKPSALGDIMHSLPVLSALRTRFPDAHIAWLVNRGFAPLLEGHPDLNQIVPFERGAFRNGWLKGGLEFARFLNHLRSHRFDLVIDLQGLLRTGLMTLATGASVRIGLASAREGAALCYTHRIDDRTDVQHAVDRYWRVIEALGDARYPSPVGQAFQPDCQAGKPDLRRGEKVFRVPVQPAARMWARSILQPLPRPWLAVGVGSRWLTKRWPPEHFAALVRMAQQAFGGSALFVGAPEEASLAQHAAALVPGAACQLTGQTTLPQLVALLSEADVMIANDTGPLHLAVALGRPVVAPYTCTVVARTGPYHQDEHAVETSIWCRGSYLKTCPRMECMAELTPDRLWPPLERILHAWQQQHRAA